MAFVLCRLFPSSWTVGTGGSFVTIDALEIHSFDQHRYCRCLIASSRIFSTAWAAVVTFVCNSSTQNGPGGLSVFGNSFSLRSKMNVAVSCIQHNGGSFIARAFVVDVVTAPAFSYIGLLHLIQFRFVVVFVVIVFRSGFRPAVVIS
jgi:hypothetical protein